MFRSTNNNVTKAYKFKTPCLAHNYPNEHENNNYPAKEEYENFDMNWLNVLVKRFPRHPLSH